LCFRVRVRTRVRVRAKVRVRVRRVSVRVGVSGNTFSVKLVFKQVRRSDLINRSVARGKGGGNKTNYRALCPKIPFHPEAKGFS